MTLISPKTLCPIENIGNELVFLNNYISKNNNITVGDYTYYHDVNGASTFQEKNVLYHHPKLNDHLSIGKFCSIAMGTRFLMSGAMHLSEGSTYPFETFDPTLSEITSREIPYEARGDTTVGHDVWFGLDSIIMPGITIGNGAIIGTRAVVTKDVPAYSVVVGSPAKIIKLRYTESVIEAYQHIEWWHWPLESIKENLAAITKGDIEALKKVRNQYEARSET